MTRNFTAELTDTEKSLDNPRVRYNWGFHDATFDVSKGFPNRMTLRPGQKDRLSRCGLDNTTPLGRAYAKGYAAGQKAMLHTTTRPQSSEAAWNAEFGGHDTPGLTE